MMKILLIIGLIFTMISNVMIAQVDQSKQLLLELEQNLYHKKFSKKWNKKKKKNWELRCQEAKTIDDINILFNEYSDLMAQLIGFSLGNSYATSNQEFISYLSEVNAVLTSELLSKWEVVNYEKWKIRVENK